MIPSEPFILLSYINTLLRDEYSSFQELCDDRELSETEIEQTLRTIGKEYNGKENRFM